MIHNPIRSGSRTQLERNESQELSSPLKFPEKSWEIFSTLSVDIRPLPFLTAHLNFSSLFYWTQILNDYSHPRTESCLRTRTANGIHETQEKGQSPSNVRQQSTWSAGRHSGVNLDCSERNRWWRVHLFTFPLEESTKTYINRNKPF